MVEAGYSAMKKMNILFIGKRFNTNRDALLEKFGRNYQFPLHLAELHNVALWLVDYHTKTTIQSIDGPLRITSTPVKNLAVFKHYLLGAYKSTQPIDMVIASGDCYIALMAQRVAKKLKAKFVFDVYDKYDEFSGYVKPLGFDLFGYLLKKADMRLFASHALLHSLGQSKHDAILSNGLDANHFRPIDKAEARRKLQLPSDTTYVGYFGSMEPDRGVQDLIAAVQILREQGQSIELLLGGKAHDSLQLDQPGIRYLGNVPFANVPYALAACDVLAIPHRRSPFLDAAAPNKVSEAMIMQRPIVATHSPNLTANFPELVEQLTPYLASPGNPNSLAQAIKKQMIDRFVMIGSEGFFWNDITEKIEKHLYRLTSEHPE